MNGNIVVDPVSTFECSECETEDNDGGFEAPLRMFTMWTDNDQTPRITGPCPRGHRVSIRVHAKLANYITQVSNRGFDDNPPVLAEEADAMSTALEAIGDDAEESLGDIALRGG